MIFCFPLMVGRHKNFEDLMNSSRDKKKTHLIRLEQSSFLCWRGKIKQQYNMLTVAYIVSDAKYTVKQCFDVHC